MNAIKLINSIINLTWLGVVVMILILGTTLFSSFTHEEATKETKEIFCGTPAFDKNLTAGKTLFKSNCATCHNKNMVDDLTGPALSGATKRWSHYPKKDLFDWIRNSSKLINEKHPRALEISKEWKGEMSSFTHLSDEDIEALLLYIER